MILGFFATRRKPGQRVATSLTRTHKLGGPIRQFASFQELINMIPICRAPKRFACALGRARWGLQPWKSQSGMLCQLKLQRFASNLDSECKSGIYREFSSAVAYESHFDEHLHVHNVSKNVLVKSILSLEGTRSAEWWTGNHPSKCPGAGIDGQLFSLPQLALDTGRLSREKIQDYFDNTWTLTEVLLSGLQGEEAFICPPYHDLRHPMIFYYGHPAALYVNKLRVAGLLEDAIDPYFEVIFETGVDEMSWDDLSKNKMSWPSVTEVHAYRKKVYHAVTNVINNISDEQLNQGIGKESPYWSLVMGFEHERIHLETSSVLISEMPTNLVRFPEGLPAYHSSAKNENAEIIKIPLAGIHYPKPEMISVESQTIALGKQSDIPSFGWDNEYGSRTYNLPAFKASKFKTTNGEFWEFVCDGGYSKAELWSDAGWQWRSFRNAKWPSYWVGEGPQGLNQFSLRLLFDVVPMAWDLPVCVNMHEATAFATWKSHKNGSHYRVLSELEHHAIRNESQQLSGPSGSVDMVLKSLQNTDINFNLLCSSMSAVTALPPNDRGFHDVFGNAWDWTTSYFSALKGFKVHPFYEDFSTPCFDGLHHVIMGGSFLSTGSEASIYSRFHFRPHFFQHASIRLVEQEPDLLLSSDTDAPGPYVGAYPFRRSLAGILEANNNKNSSENRFSSTMSKNFGKVSAAFSIPHQGFSTSDRIRDLVVSAALGVGINISESKILDVGCGQGGLSFLLARQCRFVMGIDHNQNDVETARHLLDKQTVTYTLQTEGDGNQGIPVSIDEDFRASSTESNQKVEFRCADPMCLPAELNGFDIVVLNDVIDKVSTPGSVLSRLGGVRGMVRSGGLLVILSTFDWKEEITPKSLWLGGSNSEMDMGAWQTPQEALTKRLSPDFECVGCEQVPLFWQESTRTLQGKLYHVTQWKRL